MILYGASGHAKVIIEAIKLNNGHVDFLFDDNDTIKELNSHKVYTGYNASIAPESDLIISIGENSIRKDLALKCKHSFGSVIHPNSIIAGSTKILEGTVVLASAIVQPDSFLGKHVIINTKASVDHDCKIGDYVHIAPGVTICGGVEIDEGTMIGAGATILPNIKIGKWSVIGAGSVVNKNIGYNEVWFGNPARRIK